MRVVEGATHWQMIRGRHVAAPPVMGRSLIADPDDLCGKRLSGWLPSPHPCIVVRGAHRALGHVTSSKGEKKTTKVENGEEEAAGVGGVFRERAPTWLTDMWDLAPRQRKPLKTAHESAEGGGWWWWWWC
jgi:hypothetical protein